MIYLIIIVSIIFLDLFTKYLIIKKIKLHEYKEIIKNKFYLTNIRNKGVAFGMLKDRPKTILTVNISAVSFLSALLAILIKMKIFTSYKFLLSVIIGGALGNIIDRLKRGYVTDFIYIKYKKLPIFNIADLFLFTTPLIAFLTFFTDD